MAQKTVLRLKQGQTYELEVEAYEEDISDYSGWTVYFIVKPNIRTENVAALIDEVITLDQDGQGSVLISADDTTKFPEGTYIYGAKLIDSDGYQAHTDIGEFVVEYVAYQGVNHG